MTPKSKSWLLAIVLISPFTQVNAEQIVTYRVVDAPKNSEITYLKEDFADNAYIYVTAQITNAADRQCVFLNTSGIRGFLTDDFLDLAITAQPKGFFGIESTKISPIASYTLNNKEKKCKTAWRDAITLVPLTPFSIKNSPIDPSNPAIIVQFQTSASEELSIIEPMQGMLAVAGGFATGGASTTVVGLTKITNDVLGDYFSKEFNKRRKSEVDATIPLNFTWSDIAAGANGKVINILVGERKTFEDLNKAINRIRSDNNIKPAIEISIKLEVRKSAFFDDSQFDKSGKLKKDTAISRYNILNYPKINGIQTIYQRLNSSAPANIQELNNIKSQKCDSLFSIIKDLGFNLFDRALIVGAALDDATDEIWRRNAIFYENCLKSEPKMRSTLEGIFGDGYFTPAPGYIHLVEDELAEKLPAYWTPALTKFMQQVRNSFFSKGDYRISKFPAQDLLALSARDLGSLEYFPLVGPETVENVRISDLFRKMDVTDSGCYFGWDVAAGDRPRAAMLVAVQDKEGHNVRHILDFEFDPGSIATTPKVVAFSMNQFDSPAASSLKRLSNDSVYPATASCRKKVATEVLAQK